MPTCIPLATVRVSSNLRIVEDLSMLWTPTIWSWMARDSRFERSEEIGIDLFPDPDPGLDPVPSLDPGPSLDLDPRLDPGPSLGPDLDPTAARVPDPEVAPDLAAGIKKFEENKMFALFLKSLQIHLCFVSKFMLCQRIHRTFMFITFHESLEH